MSIDILIALLIFVLGFVFIGYSFFICKKVVPKVDYQLKGWNYDYDSWFAQILRANEYTSYSMIPNRARKAGVYEQFFAMDPWIRRHLLIWMCMAFFGVLMMVIAAVLENFLKITSVSDIKGQRYSPSWYFLRGQLPHF